VGWEEPVAGDAVAAGSSLGPEAAGPDWPTMPRRKGHEEAGPKVDLAAAAKQLRCQLAQCIAAGSLQHSIAPDWGLKGSSFQRLEWLGDAVLQLYLTQQIYGLCAGNGASEGQMSDVRKACEDTHCLARVFKSLDLARLLRHPGGNEGAPNYLVNEKKCADVVESILGELFEVAKGEEEQRRRGEVASQAGGAVPEALHALLDLVLRTGLAECPQRFFPPAVETVSLLLVGLPGVPPPLRKAGDASGGYPAAAKAAAAVAASPSNTDKAAAVVAESPPGTGKAVVAVEAPPSARADGVAELPGADDEDDISSEDLQPVPS